MDDSLKAKLRAFYAMARNSGLLEKEGYKVDEDAWIAQIDQAYLEDGYFKPADVYGNKLMTGQEWYERFEREYHMSADWIAADESMGGDAEHDVLNAAKRAAGLFTD